MDQEYNGWTNWDTWQAYKLLSNDYLIYGQLMEIAKKNILYFRVMVIKALNHWYIQHPIDDKFKIDYTEINFVELKKRIHIGN